MPDHSPPRASASSVPILVRALLAAVRVSPVLDPNVFDTVGWRAAPARPAPPRPELRLVRGGGCPEGR